MKKIILISFSILLGVGASQAQTRMVINNGGYMVIQNNGYLVVDNPNTNAITEMGGNGNIVSEGENNVVKWNISAQTGTYKVPFTTNSGVNIPLEVNIQNAGSAGGDLLLSTYETANDDNTMYPSMVNNMNGSCNGDNSLYAIDRFWRLDANSYTTKPDVAISFGYDDAANEMGGTNTITEANLVAQRYNSAANSWEAPQNIYGTVNTSTNKVQNATVTGGDFYETWTLIDTNSFIVYDTIYTTICDNDSVLINGAYQNTAGTYTFLKHYPTQCDTVSTTIIDVNVSYFASLSTTKCYGDSLLAEGSYQLTSGTYYDTLNTGSGCDSIIESILTILPLNETNITLQICNGDSALIGGTYYLSSTVINEIFADANGCDSLINTTLSVVNSITQTNNITICENEFVSINGANVNTAGTYTETFQSAGGCDSIVTTNLTVNPLPVISIQTNENEILSGELIQLDVTSGYSYLWTPADLVDCDTCQSVESNPTENTTYFVEAFLNGCATSDSITISIKNIDLTIPFGFSPNDDNISDVWFIEGLEQYPDNNVTILNRWGNVVYKAAPYNNDWTGTYKEEPLPIGTYFFIIDLGDGSETIKGYIYINR